MSQPTDTPITNSHEIDNAQFADYGVGLSGYVDADAMRELERNYNQLEIQLEQLSAELKELNDYYRPPTT